MRGGASRELHLEAVVEGTRASLSHNTFWKSDNRLYYLSADQPEWGKFSLVTLQGHDSVRLLALLALPLFALNSRSFRGGPPDLVWRIMAVLALSFFLWISLSLFQRLLGPWGTDWDIQQRTSLFLMAANDLTPLRAGTDDPLPLLLAFLNLMLTLYLSIAILWLLVRVERRRWSNSRERRRRRRQIR